MERRRVGRRPAADLDDIIYGVHAVTEALHGGEKLRRIHVADERRRDPALRGLLNAAREQGVAVRFESRGFFAQFPYKAHQSVIAFSAPFDYVGLHEALAARRQPSLFVVLDHVTDPHNVGAIIRTAEAVGADALILPERRSAGVNGTVRKASAGAAAYLPIVRVSNVAQALRSLKDAGIWIAGADSSPGGIAYTRADLSVPLALVIGAEGGGISPVARKEWDYLLSIPMAGKIASLNASVAAAVLLYEAKRQREAL